MSKPTKNVHMVNAEYQRIVKQWRLHGATRLEHEQVIYERCADELEAALSAQPRQGSGLELAARFVDQRREDYDSEHGSTDPETGTREYPGTGDEYVGELHEIAEGIRAIQQPASAPVGVEGLAGKIGVHYAQHESCKPGVPFYAFTVGELRAFAAALAQQPGPDATFADWLATEMPAGTIIGDPAWWANRIARQYAVRCKPAEAQAQGGGEVPESELIALVAGPFKYHHKMDEAAEREARAFDRCRELTIQNIRTWCATRRAMRAAAPPSAPVGVEGLAEMWTREAAKLVRNARDARARGAATVDDFARADRLDAKADGLYEAAADLLALAQQPAAVDEAPTYRLLSSADEIRADDEFLGDDTVTWLPVGKEFLSASMCGKKYNPSFLQPMRRETPFTAAQQDASHD